MPTDPSRSALAVVPDLADADAGDPAGGSRGAPQWLHGGWLPALVTAGLGVALLRYYDVPVSDLLAFATYEMLAVTVPGTLWWRASRRRAGLFVEDVAAGTALGCAIELPMYLLARMGGMPRLVVVWPAVTIVAFLLVPALRRYWRGAGRDGRLPLPLCWSIAGVVGLLLVRTGTGFFATHGLDWPANSAPYVDIPYHIALTAELKHHFPVVTPLVTGEPLAYHWFGYAHLAAASWVSGVEPQMLVLRLAVIPAFVGLAVLIATMAHRLTGRWWPAALALLLVYLTEPANVYGWTGAPVPSGSVLSTLWVSPAQTFGHLLFAAAMVLILDAYQRREPVTTWVVLAVLLAAVSGTRATVLPLLLAGVLTTIAVHALVRRRLHRPSVIVALMTIPVLAFAQVVVFGGGTWGTGVKPLDIAVRLPIGRALSLTPGHTSLRALGVAGVVIALAWLLTCGGILGLAADREARWDPRYWLLLGIGAGGLGAMLLLTHPGASQLFFLQVARPYLALAGASGIAVAVSRLSISGRSALAVLGVSGLAGMAIAWMMRRTGSSEVPTRRGLGAAGLVWTLTWPYLAIAAILLATAALLATIRRRTPATSGLALAVPLALMVGTTLPGELSTAWQTTNYAAGRGWKNIIADTDQMQLPPGAVEASRWLRDHSDPDDLTATNMHCLPGRPPCDPRHFWVAALTERRVLVEGWAYTKTGLAAESKPGNAPFWNPPLLEANDAVFEAPTRANVDSLRSQYGVRWLIADRYFGQASPDLDRFTGRRFSSGSVTIYELA
jgi:hypothetical protein